MGNEQSSQEKPLPANKEPDNDESDYSDVSDEKSAGPLAHVNGVSVATDFPTNRRSPYQALANRPNEGKTLLPRTPQKNTSPTLQSIVHLGMMPPPGTDQTDSAKKKRRKRIKKRRSSMSGTSSSLARTITNESADIEISTQLHHNDMDARDLQRVRSQEEEELRKKEPELFGHYDEASDTPDANPVVQDDERFEHSATVPSPVEETQERTALLTSLDNINKVNSDIDVAINDHSDPIQDDAEDLGIAAATDSETELATGFEDHEQGKSHSASANIDAFVPIRPQGHEDSELANVQRKQSGFKRKRNVGVEASIMLRASAKKSKRQRRNSYSLAVDIDQPFNDAEALERSDVEVDNATGVSKHEDGRKLKQAPPKSFGSSSRLSKAKPLRNGTLDRFATPIQPNLSRNRSLYTPQSADPSHQVEIRVPRSASNSTSSSIKPRRSGVTGANSGETGSKGTHNTSGNASRRQAYTTPKGKGKATSDFDYVSSDKEHASGGHSLSSCNEEDSEHGEMATTIATKTSHKNKKHQKMITFVDSDIEKPPISVSSDHSDDATNSEDLDDGSDDEKPYTCKVCHRRYETNDKLNEHERSGNGHGKLHQCSKCSKKYWSRKALGKHEKQARHGSGNGYAGRKGQFSDEEKAKLETWKENFCKQHDIDSEEFNNMMTESCRRSHETWTWQFITKYELLDEYYSQLPGRNKRSMIRYRERNFQNAERTQWTVEEDEELERLVKELGQKWVEIGLQMSRTQDSVSQRWRHKLNHGQKSHSGDWTPAEVENLIKTVEGVAQSSGISLENPDTPRIPWETVSKKMDSVRTAQQCSNKWRILTKSRIGGKFTPIPHYDRMPGSVVKTPSSVTKRIKGKNTSSTKKSTLKRKYKSSEKVVDSDNEDVQQQTVEPQANEKNRHGEDALTIEQPDESKRGTDRPAISQNPLNAHTPAASKMSMTQLINGTQANTSATRASTSRKSARHAPERPSPDIPVRTRPASSPLEMLAGANDDDEYTTETGSGTDESQSPRLRPNARDQRSNSLGTEEVLSSEAGVQPESDMLLTPHRNNDRAAKQEDKNNYIPSSSQGGWASINGFKNRFMRRVMPGLTKHESDLSEVLQNRNAHGNDDDNDE